MAKSKVDLIYQSLRNLGALPMGQDPGDDEFEHVDGLVDPTLASLRTRDVYFLPDVDSIPDEAFIPLSHCLTWSCAAGFGQQSDVNLYQLKEEAEKHLTIQQSERPYFDILQVQAY